ncbi:MAG: hypothetical protein KKA97_01060 [Actinobacteria bacterium]|nr:hypothetical protein [Actinomycetota bacterium]
MLFVFLVLVAVVAFALLAAPQASPNSTATSRPASARTMSSTASSGRPPSPRPVSGRRYWSADDLPGPGQEPATLRQVYKARGGVDFVFSFERQPGGRWRAYIERGMPYGSRGSGLHVTHRLRNGPRHYVCFTPEPTSLQAMAKVATYWADMTVTYARTGRTIDQQVATERSATA